MGIELGQALGRERGGGVHLRVSRVMRIDSHQGGEDDDYEDDGHEDGDDKEEEEEQEDEEQDEEEEDNRKRNYSDNDDDSDEEEEDEEMNKKPAARAQPLIHNTRPQNKRTLEAAEEPANKSNKRSKKGPTTAKEGTTWEKTPRPVRSKNAKK